MHQTRGDLIAGWIEDYCRVPSGPDRGKRVRLTEAELYAVRRYYDCPDGPQDLQVEGNLAAYLALLHTCGIEACDDGPRPQLHTDPWTVWNASNNPMLRRVLKREPDAVACPQLGTRFPRAA